VNYKRLLIVLPGLLVWFLGMGVNDRVLKYKYYGFAILLYGIGWLVYRYLLRTKSDEQLDKEVAAKSEAAFQSGIDNAANIIPNTQVKLANALQSLLSKADNKSPADKIRELDLLKTEGVITEDEFKQAKAKLLGL
jgi:hypothetical protein